MWPLAKKPVTPKEPMTTEERLDKIEGSVKSIHGDIAFLGARIGRLAKDVDESNRLEISGTPCEIRLINVNDVLKSSHSKFGYADYFNGKHRDKPTRENLGIKIGTKEHPIKLDDLPNEIFSCMTIRFMFHIMNHKPVGLPYQKRESQQIIEKKKYYALKWAWGSLVTFKEQRTPEQYCQFFDLDGTSYKTYSLKHTSMYFNCCRHVYVCR